MDGLEYRKIPCILPGDQGIDRREAFASDCVIRHRVLISGYSPLESPNSPRQRLLLHICGSGETHFPVGDSQIRGQNLRWQMRRDHPSRTRNGVELGVIFFLTVAFNCRRMRNRTTGGRVYATAKRQVPVRFRQGIQGLLRQTQVGMPSTRACRAAQILS